MSSREAPTETRRSREHSAAGFPALPPDHGPTRLGLIAAPGHSSELTARIRAEVAAGLGARYPGSDWRVTVVSERQAGPVRGGIDLIDSARRRLLAEGWHMAICLSEQALTVAGRPVVARTSRAHRVGIVSVPALGPVGLRRKARDLVLRVMERLLGVAAETPYEALRLALAHLTMPVRERVDESEVRFVAGAIAGNLRLIFGMVRANRPWELAARLSRALAAALAVVAFALVTSDIWRLSSGIGDVRLSVLALAAIAATSVSLIVAHELWERSSVDAAGEQVILFNVATTLTVAIGVLALYGALFLLSLVGALLLVDGGVFSTAVRHHVGFGAYVRLAWLVSSLATVGGALGAALESDIAVREAAYAYAHDDHEGDDNARGYGGS